MATYQYTPLNLGTGETRLLELHPGNFDAAIRISITKTPFHIPQPTQVERHRLERVQNTLPSDWRVHESIDGRLIFKHTKSDHTLWTHPDPKYSSVNCSSGEKTTALCRPSYEALSYVWGTETAEAPIQIVSSAFWAGASPAAQESVSFFVRQNLYDALKYLRFQNTSRFLWIDAICINQSDITERNQQVGRMGDIYKYASRVIVWLGLPSHGSSSALGLMRYLGNQVVFTKSRRVLAAPDCEDPDLWIHRDARSIDRNPKIWDAVYYLMQRSWFDRLWILQEIQLANASALVQCGHDTITWIQLRTAMRTCAHLQFPGPEYRDLHRLAFKRKQLTNDAAELGPLRLLTLALSAGCADMRDKFYALLGLFPEVFSRQITPNYDRPTLEVHRDVVRAYIECTGNLDILLLAGPSWTPNWSVSREPMAGDGVFSSGNSEANISHSEEDELAATGVLYDTVETVAGPLASDDDQSIADLVRAVYLKDMPPTRLYPTGGTLAEACAWVLNCGRLQQRWGEDPLLTTVEEASRIFHRIGHEDDLKSAPLLRATVVEGSFIFRTGKGYFGLCCQQVMPGDRVSVLLGSSCPVILRQQQPDERYLFIGCAYVHGIMDGEVLLGPLSNHTVIVDHDRYNNVLPIFVNTTTKIATRHDPRLGAALPEGWRQILTQDRLWPERLTTAFQNNSTGQILFSDPRLLPDALMSRGVELVRLRMV